MKELGIELVKILRKIITTLYIEIKRHLSK